MSANNRSVRINGLKIGLKKITALTNEQRYVYYLLGHMFNELMCMQKLVAYALPKHDDRRPFRRLAELSQALLLFRLSTAKIYEAKIILDTQVVQAVLEADVFPFLEFGRRSYVHLTTLIEGSNWLSSIRNRSAFHYPKYSQWSDYVRPTSSWVDDSIFIGEQSGNTFYEASEAIARHWMFSQIERKDGETEAEVIDRLIENMISLLKSATNFLEEAMGTFVMRRLVDDERPTIAGKVSGPDFERVAIPFWTHMARSKQETT